MTVGEVICSLGDVHIYENHVEGIKEQLTRDYHKFNLPKLELNKNITIISKNINEELIKKYNSQYTNIKFINNNSFHDRFIIIDNKELYHSGSSFKDLGKKCFAITKIEDIDILNNLLKEIYK